MVVAAGGGGTPVVNTLAAQAGTVAGSSAGAAGGSGLVVAGGTVTAMAYRSRQRNMGLEAETAGDVAFNAAAESEVYVDVFAEETNTLFAGGDAI